MEIKFIDTVYNIEEFLQPEEIRYAKECGCSCGSANYLLGRNYKIAGFTLTSNGYMVVFECTVCGEKYRHHVSTTGRNDIVTFKQDLGLILYLTHERAKKQPKSQFNRIFE